jgi:hypothetical protein
MGKWRNSSPLKKVWTPAEEQFLLDNWHLKNSYQLSSELGITRTLVRTKLYEMGLKKMELQRWTEEQIELLKTLYKQMGDTEIAQLFASKWPKKKGWSKKHIEKKRRQLFLKRTPAEITAIMKNNCKVGGPNHTIEKNSSSKNLHPKWVVQTIAWRNKDLQHEILEHHPELIEQKKMLIKVRRKLKDIANNKNQTNGKKQTL